MGTSPVAAAAAVGEVRLRRGRPSCDVPRLLRADPARDGVEDVHCTGVAAAVVAHPGTDAAAAAACAADGDAGWAFAAGHGGRAFARDGEDHRGLWRRGDGAVLGNIAAAGADGRFAVACGSCFWAPSVACDLGRPGQLAVVAAAAADPLPRVERLVAQCHTFVRRCYCCLSTPNWIECYQCCCTSFRQHSDCCHRPAAGIPS